ncbi:hypothetical protein Misp06_03978 [Microbulbifer sp. NBRC 101763]
MAKNQALDEAEPKQVLARTLEERKIKKRALWPAVSDFSKED